MDFINLSIVPIDDAIEEVIKSIRQLYDKEVIDIDTDNTIRDIFEDLSDDLTVCIEYPYVDKVYRDSFYHYFSSKHSEYSRDCLRILLFDNIVEQKHFSGATHQPYLQECFAGYIVIRPTFPRVIGRTLIDKRAIRNPNFLICQSRGSVLFHGMKLTVTGFPFSSQDQETITCAETSIWALMEYFGNRYPEYRPTLPSKILSVLNVHSHKRMLPSSGLTVDQISYALKDFGFGTYIYGREEFAANFENIIATYIESGIPVVATLSNKKVVHAALIIGHEPDDKLKFNYKRKIEYGRKKISYIDYTDIKKRYVIQDDNLTPYKLIDLGNPAEHYDSFDKDFAGCTIDYVVVPLYSKIYLEADVAKKLVLKILTDHEYGFKFSPDFVLRFFLTSSRSFKEHIRSLPRLDKNLQQDILITKMPKFIWCAEVFKKGKFKSNHAEALIVLDATEASEIEQKALIFAAYPDRSIINTGKKIVILDYKLDLYTKFKNNLV